MSVDLLTQGLVKQRYDQLGFRSKLPFHLKVGDGKVALTATGGADLTTITDRTGRAGTFTRASNSGLVVASNGRLVQSFTDFPALESWDHDADGVYETAGLHMGLARTNLITTQDISAWTSDSTPTVTAVPGPYAGVSEYLIDDNDAGVGETKRTVVTFTGNAVKACAVIVRQGTSATYSLRLHDATAAAYRLYAEGTWSGSDPGTPTMTTGTFHGKRQLSDGRWILFFQTTSVTAANTHNFYLDGTAAATATGSTYWSMPTIVDAPFLTTVLTASQAPVKDDLRFTFPFLVQACSLYIKFTEVGTRYDTSSQASLVSLCLNSNSGTDPRLDIYTGSGQTGYVVEWDPGTQTTASLAAYPAIGQQTELLVTLTSAGVATIIQSIAGAATTQAVASAQALPTTPTYFGNSQANARLVIGDLGPSGTAPAALSLHEVKVDWGVKTMAEMRSAA